MKALNLNEQHLVREFSEQLEELQARKISVSQALSDLVMPIATQSLEHCQEMLDLVPINSTVHMGLYRLLEAFKKERGD